MRQFCIRALMSVALLALATGASAQVKLDTITTFVDGGSGLPNHAVQGPDGAFYAISTFTTSTSVAFFRIDAVTKVQTVVATLDMGQDAPNASRLVLAPDGRFYASFNAMQGGGIVSFDPGTNSAAVIHTFPLDPDTLAPGAEGAYPGPLTLGRDGRFYGAMSNAGADGVGSLFTYHPWTDTFETLHEFNWADDGGVFPVEALVEGPVNGVFYGVNLDVATFCGNAFKYDLNADTLTSLDTFDGAAEGCFPGALAVLQDGRLIGVTTAFGGTVTSDPVLGDTFNPALGGIFTLDPATGAVTPLHMFLAADGLSPILPGNVTVTPGGRVYVLAQDFSLGVAKVLRVNPATGAVETIQELSGPRPEIGMLTVGSDARLYGVFDSTTMFALGVLDSIAVAPAGGSAGGTTTLSATLKALGMPLAGRMIAFSLNGVSVGSAMTNAAGVATLDAVSLAGVAAGSYPNAIEASFAGDDQFPAGANTGLLDVQAVVVSTPGIMLGDGYVAANLLRYDFKFLVLEKANGTDRGKLDLRIRDLDDRKKKNKTNNRFVSTSYTDVVFNFDQADRPMFDTVVFKGTGTWNGVAGYRFEAFAEDRAGAPWRGRNRETFRIVIYSSTNEVVASAEGTVKGGFLLSKRLRK